MVSISTIKTKRKYKLNEIAWSGAFIVGLFNTNFVYASAVVETGQFVASDVFYRVIDKDLAKITFEEGSSDLSKESFATLSDFVKATAEETKIDRHQKVDTYIVATWSDQDFPANGELHKDQRQLADLRSDSIRKGLRAAGAKNIQTFPMTSEPNWIQRVFSTETAEIKNKGRSNTEHERLYKEIGQKLREHGGPGTAVVVAKFRNEVLSE